MPPRAKPGETELSFTRLFAAVAACIGAVTQDELVEDGEAHPLTAAYLIAEGCGLCLDHRHDRENAVRLLVQALQRTGVELALEGEGPSLNLLGPDGVRVALKLGERDVERTFQQISAVVPASVARVFTLTPSDDTDAHLFAVVPAAKLVLLNAALGGQFSALFRDLGKRPRKHVSYSVSGVPGARAAPASGSSRDIGFGFACDGRLVARPGAQPIQVKDPATVRALHPYWLVDSKHVYFLGRAARAIDPNSVEILHDHFARDAEHVFYANTMLDVDRDSFELFAEQGRIAGEVWGRDRSSVYFFEDLDLAPRKLTANPAAFRVRGEHATDGVAVFCTGRKLAGANAASWRRLPGRYWSTDGKRVYYFSQRLEKADPNSFEPVLQYWALDRSNVYNRGVLATPEAARAEAALTFAFIGETRVVRRSPSEHRPGDLKITLAIRCQRWLRRPEKRRNTPEPGEEREETWYLRPQALPDELEGQRVLVVTQSPRDGNHAVAYPNPAWEHQTVDRLAVMERFLALAD